jgi:allantoate deiminase
LCELTRIEIDSAMLAQYVETLGAIGQQAQGGIIRPVFSPAWREARQQLATWMSAAGLDVREDAVGNLFGRLRGRDDTRTILTGSHIDTVKLGGKYDGALGVLAALAALATLRQQYGQPGRTLEVVALCEEEGSRFQAHYWGSRGLLGLIRPDELTALRDDEGLTIAGAMQAAGFEPARYQEAVRRDLDAFLELHIEQGGILYAEQVDIGVVEAIAGMQRQYITVEGRPDHAGTTPMDLRRDALQGAALMAVEITRMVEEEGRPAVVTTGIWDVCPGAFNVVPGRVRFSLDLRHPDDVALRRLSQVALMTCEQIASRRDLSVSRVIVDDSSPIRMHTGLQQVIIAAARASGASWKYLSSGAGHDSEVLARHIPTAMLFVPSVDGRSHQAAEYTLIKDAARGAGVLATALYALAYLGSLPTQR